MRKILSLVAMLALAGCGGGSGGGSTPAPPPPTVPTSAPQSGLVTPTFTLVIPARTTSSRNRTPQRVSPGTKSVTITRTSQPTVTPTSVSTDITPTGPCPCTVTVNGPPSPPGVQNDFVVATYDALGGAGGGGNQLDAGTKSFTPVVGTNNSVTITLMGIPKIIVIGALPTTFAAGTGSSSPQNAPLSIDVQDAAGKTIATGTYANTVTITDPDAETYGTSLSGTPCSANVCTLATSADATAVTFNYKGVAENPVTITSSGTGLSSAGNAVFTPVLQPIVYNAGPTSLYTGNSPVTAPVNQGCGAAAACGIDLYATSGIGSTGVESYKEPGFTTTPYNKTLFLQGNASCSAFANFVAADNTTTGNTDFTATATATPSAGVCLVSVSDGLAAAKHFSNGPQFVATYTTSGISASAKRRHQ